MGLSPPPDPTFLRQDPEAPLQLAVLGGQAEGQLALRWLQVAREVGDGAMQAAHLVGGTRGSVGPRGALSQGSGSASGSRAQWDPRPPTLTLPMVSSFAKLWVHQILVVLLPFFGLSVAAEGCE